MAAKKQRATVCVMDTTEDHGSSYGKVPMDADEMRLAQMGKCSCWSPFCSLEDALKKTKWLYTRTEKLFWHFELNWACFYNYHLMDRSRSSSSLIN